MGQICESVSPSKLTVNAHKTVYEYKNALVAKQTTNLILAGGDKPQSMTTMKHFSRPPSGRIKIQCDPQGQMKKNQVLDSQTKSQINFFQSGLAGTTNDNLRWNGSSSKSVEKHGRGLQRSGSGGHARKDSGS